MHLSVIIPAKNEEKHIRSTVESVYSYLSSQSFDYEVIVVSNNSTDQTVSIVQDMIKNIPQLKILDYPNKAGKGFAVREGMLQAQGDYRLFMDADNATTIDQIETMMPYFDQGYEIIIGSIAVGGHKVKSGSEPLWRVLFGKLGNLFIQIIAVPGIHDTQRGFKLMTSRSVQAIFPRLRVSRWAFDVEVLALARKLGYKIKEVPVKWQNDPNTSSHPKFSDYPKFLFEVIKIKWRLMTSNYDRVNM